MRPPVEFLAQLLEQALLSKWSRRWNFDRLVVPRYWGLRVSLKLEYREEDIGERVYKYGSLTARHGLEAVG